MFYCNLQFFDLNFEMRDFLLGIVDFSHYFFIFPLQFFPLFLHTLHIFVLETTFELVQFDNPGLFLLVQLFDLVLNVLKFLLKISFLDVERKIHQFVFDLLPSIDPTFELFLFVTIIVHNSLVIFVLLPLRLEL